MNATADNTTTSSSARAAHRSASKLVSGWSQFRQTATPWAYPRLRVLAAIRFAVGLFLVGTGVVLIARGHDGWGAIPLAGAVMVAAIASLDMSAARVASR